MNTKAIPVGLAEINEAKRVVGASQRFAEIMIATFFC